VHLLVTEGRHFVAVIAGTGLVVAGVAAVIGLADGQRGGHEVVAFVTTVGVVGILSVFLGTCLDPMGFPGGYLGRTASPAAPEELRREQRTGRRPERKKQLRTDDILYGGGVLLIGLAVLIWYACTWAGVPASPFG
jgi:hypothetical protein